MDRFEEVMDRLQEIIHQKEQEEAQRMNEAIEANFAKIKANLNSWDSCCRQSISTDECEKSTEEWSMKEILESQNEDKEMGYVLQQVEEEEIIEEIVEDRRLEEVEQATSYTVEDNSTPTDVLFEIVEPSLLCCEIDVEEARAQPPTYDLNNKECIEEVGEQGIEIEEACQEVEVVKEEHKGVELARSLGPPLPKSPSSILSFKWVNLLSVSFTFPLEYGLLETDGQLRALCRVKSKRELISGWKCQSRFLMVGNSRSKCNG
ncbi:hypothetical protein Ahy_B08g091729 [Arachis hypogaea]|uniref:Uncharacterized protein n=1 Tax=Arachis hypogaea TaxID=3818 RepID=A0A444Y2K4_ARAHY|nr:hypothetical protein Ahy_B08g091729 [Arachis hypogaea]